MAKLLAMYDDQVFPFDLDIGPMDIDGGRLLLAHLRDIRRRMAAEARTTLIFEHIGDGVFTTDHKGTIIMASRSADQLIGVPDDEVIGQDITDHQNKEQSLDWKKFTELSSYVGISGQGEPVVSEDLIRRDDGSEIPVEWMMATFAVGAGSVLHRCRSRPERSESRQRPSNAIRAAGNDAQDRRRAAHEISQPLTTFLGYVEMSLVQLDETSPVYRNQKLIANAAARITEIIKRMQTIREYKTRPYTNGHRIVDFRPDDKRQPD